VELEVSRQNIGSKYMASGRAPERWERKVIVGVRIVRNKAISALTRR